LLSNVIPFRTVLTLLYLLAISKYPKP
jgi:hypothetical protein